MLVLTVCRADTFHWLAQAIRVLVNILERDRFGANMASAQRIVLITPDVRDRVTFGLNHQSTHGFAQVADPVMGPGTGVAHSLLTLKLLGTESGTVWIGRRPALHL